MFIRSFVTTNVVVVSRRTPKQSSYCSSRSSYCSKTTIIKTPLSSSSSSSHYNYDDGSNHSITSNKQLHRIHLTLLLPAYNEEFRIRPTLVNYTNYLLSSSCCCSSPAYVLLSLENDCCVDILVVNDGSTDGTADVVEECNRILLDKHHHQQQQQQQQSTTMMLKSINCLSLAKNEGKGSAISRGLAYIANQTKQQIVLLQQDGLVSNQNVTRIPTTSSTRHWVLVADADGSGDIRYLNAMLLKFDQLLKETTMYKNNTDDNETKEENRRQNEPYEDAMLIGNRMDKSASPSRRITRWGFQTMVKWICGDLQVRDTQCGMKLMTLDAGLATYSNLHLQRWTHDVEVLYRARELNIPVTEMDVGWEDKDGSKLVTGSWVQTIWVSGVMLMEVIIMRVQYMLGRWKVEVDMEEGGGSGAKE